MKPLQLVFCHGFGFDSDFWCNLAPYFKEHDCFFFDLGYFSAKETIIAPNFKDYQVVAVGHSLGVLKLLKFSSDFKAIISLQGFTNFLGNDPKLHKKRQQEWQQMRTAFNYDPKATMLKFYSRVFNGSNNELRQKLAAKIDLMNIKKLSLDLDDLIIPSEAKFNHMLSIASLDDQIVPPILITDNFASSNKVKIVTYNSGGHLLGLVESGLVAQEIKNFLDEIKN